MYPKNMIIGAIVFILVAAGLGTLVYVQKQRMNEEQSPVVEEQPTGENPYGITRIDAKHFFVDGTHTLAGEIAFPTPCDLLDVTARVTESYPEQVTVEFNVVNNADMCAQVVTNQRFKVSFDASEEASIKATFMGQPIELNLVPPAEGETPEDFELFIKG